MPHKEEQKTEDKRPRQSFFPSLKHILLAYDFPVNNQNVEPETQIVEFLSLHGYKFTKIKKINEEHYLVIMRNTEEANALLLE